MNTDVISILEYKSDIYPEFQRGFAVSEERLVHLPIFDIDTYTYHQKRSLTRVIILKG